MRNKAGSGKSSHGAGLVPWRQLAPWFALLLIAAVLAAMWLLRVREPATPHPEQPAIVVLPLHGAGNGGGGQTALAESMSRELISRLAHADGVRVVAWASSARAQAEKFDMAQLDERLHVSHALAGTLRQADDHLLLELRLSSVPDGRMLWAQTYTRKREEMRALEREATEAIGQALGHKLQESEADAENHPALWLEYAAARHLLAARERTRGEDALRALLAHAPDYAPAQASLARSRAAALRGSAADTAELGAITTAAGRALAADKQLVDAHVALAIIACRGTDWSACLDGFRQALTLDPADTDARVTYAYWLAGIGYVDRALGEVETAWSADPLNYDTNFARARLLDTRGKHDQALESLAAASPPSPGLIYARWHNAVWRHDLAAARDIAAAMPQSDGFRESYAGITEALTEPSRWPQIQPMIATSERANGHINTLRIMMPDADYRLEIDGLERMLRDSWPSYYLLLWMPEYAAMRRDPAFQDFLQRTHILDYWRSTGFPAQCHVSGDLAMCD